jgi:hypothetical protein
MTTIFVQRRMALAVVINIFVCAALLGCTAATSPGRASRLAAHRTPVATVQPSVTSTTGSSGASVELQTTAMTLTPAAHLNFSGSGFSPGELLAVTVMSSAGHVEAQLPTAVADTDGNIGSNSQVMPANLGPGTHLLVVRGTTSQRTAQAEFQVQRLPPTVQLDAYAGEPGYVFRVAGGGFTSGEEVDIFLGSAMGAPLAVLTATTGGDIAGQVKVPARPSGVYPLQFVGRVSQTPASVKFDIEAFKPWVVLDTYSPLPGAPVRFSGRDFAPGEQVLVYLTAARGQPVTTIEADADGTFTHAGDFVVSSGLTGHQILVFVGQQSQVPYSTTFDVYPAASAQGGPPGSPETPQP